MTIHYITIHHATTRWIDIQLRHIDHFTNNYKVWTLFSKDIDIDAHKDKYHFASYKQESHPKQQSEDHGRALDALTNIVCSNPNVKEGDILLFIDSDALPINNVNEYVESKLKKYPFCAVNRIENLGCLSPHPSFAFCTVKFWKDHQCTWGRDQSKDGHVDYLADTGARLLYNFKDNNIDWFRIQRDSKKSLFTDPLLYVVYGDIVYHHCAGSRGVFKTRATSSYMLNESNLPFFSKIYEHVENHIWNTINSDYFIKKD